MNIDELRKRQSSVILPEVKALLRVHRTQQADVSSLGGLVS